MNWSIPVRKVFSVLCNNMKHFLKTRALKEITAVLVICNQKKKIFDTV